MPEPSARYDLGYKRLGLQAGLNVVGGVLNHRGGFTLAPALSAGGRSGDSQRNDRMFFLMAVRSVAWYGVSGLPSPRFVPSSSSASGGLPGLPSKIHHGQRCARARPGGFSFLVAPIR